MRTHPRMMRLIGRIGFVISVQLAAVLVCAAGPPPVRLSPATVDFARDLIERGQFIADKKGAWAKDHSTRSDENDFISEHGFAEYSKWFLGLDDRHAAKSKVRYKFPFGDFRNIHRCGLLAIKARAHEYGYRQIEDVAASLLDMMESTRPVRQKRVD